jgi:hypothetical protein
VVELLDRGQHGLPVGDGLPGQQGVDGRGRLGRILTGGHTCPHVARELDELLGFRPVAVVGGVDRGDGETPFGGEPVRAGQNAGGLLVLAAAVSHQDQRAGAGGVLRREQDAGDLAEGEGLFGDAVGRHLRGQAEAHGVSKPFGGAWCGRSLDHPWEGAPTCHHSVDRSHLLWSWCLTAPPNLSQQNVA